MAAYRLPYLLAGDALVLKQQSPYYEHFYKDLQEWYHYVPFSRDLSDLEEKLKWAIDNDEKVKKIYFCQDSIHPRAIKSLNGRA